MTQAVSYVISGDGTINVLLDKPFTVTTGHLNYGKIRELLKNPPDNLDEELHSLLNIEKAVQEQSAGRISLNVEAKTLTFDGYQFNNAMADRLCALVQEGYKIDHFLRFAERIMANPSKRALDECFSFLQDKGFPITPEGTFLAYKALDANFMDKHTHSIFNGVGEVISMPRNCVDDNVELQCSYGFHVGNLTYVNGFGSRGIDKFVIVEVDPANVVCVPSCETNKMRVCKYKVVREMPESDIMVGSVYNQDGFAAPRDNDEEYCDDCGEVLEDGICPYCDEEDYPDDVDDDDYETCPECGIPIEDCTCDYDITCQDCGELLDDCVCDDDDWEDEDEEEDVTPAPINPTDSDKYFYGKCPECEGPVDEYGNCESCD